MDAGQLIELLKVLQTSGQQNGALNHDLIGKPVVVRCRDAGVHFGILKSASGRQCVLTDARRLWHWITKKESDAYLGGVANHGLDEKSKVGETVTEIMLTENCEIIRATEIARQSIMALKVHHGS